MKFYLSILLDVPLRQSNLLNINRFRILFIYLFLKNLSIIPINGLIFFICILNVVFAVAALSANFFEKWFRRSLGRFNSRVKPFNPIACSVLDIYSFSRNVLSPYLIYLTCKCEWIRLFAGVDRPTWIYLFINMLVGLVLSLVACEGGGWKQRRQGN